MGERLPGWEPVEAGGMVELARGLENRFGLESLAYGGMGGNLYLSVNLSVVVCAAGGIYLRAGERSMTRQRLVPAVVFQEYEL